MKCAEDDGVHNNIYINDGSIRPTTKLTDDGLPEAKPADGNTVEIQIIGSEVSVVALSIKDGREIAKVYFSDVR